MSESPRHRPRKRFGQHFLHDPTVIERIVRAIRPVPGPGLVEIGPGLGALTRPLLEAAGELDVIELDRDLIAPLEALAPGRLHVHAADALTVDLSTLRPDLPRLRMVGNLPYNISTPLLFHLIDQAHRVQDMHFMLQKEVVDRMAAPPGGRDYGRLSVMVQWHCQVESLFRVGPGAFRPPPKVHSAVVRLIPRREPPVPVHSDADFARVVKLAFSQRRKTLRNTLRPLLSAEAIAAAGIDPGDRPERLSLIQFAALANAVSDPADSSAS